MMKGCSMMYSRAKQRVVNGVRYRFTLRMTSHWPSISELYCRSRAASLPGRPAEQTSGRKDKSATGGIDRRQGRGAARTRLQLLCCSRQAAQRGGNARVPLRLERLHALALVLPCASQASAALSQQAEARSGAPPDVSKCRERLTLGASSTSHCAAVRSSRTARTCSM